MTPSEQLPATWNLNVPEHTTQLQITNSPPTPPFFGKSLSFFCCSGGTKGDTAQDSVISSKSNKKGTVATSTPKKQENNAFSEEGLVPNEKTDPIVAFSRPPPLPPVLGPFIALSLFEMWSSRDGDDD